MCISVSVVVSFMCFVFVYLYLWSTGTFWVNGVGEARMSDVFVLLAHTLPTYLRPVSRSKD